MNVLTNVPPLSPSELARRVAEYRKLGFERRAPVQVVYQEPFVVCPWPGCGLRIDGVHFQLDRWLEKSQQERLLDAWWKGPGIVGRCPKCNQYVLFSIDSKSAVKDVSTMATAMLPDEWVTSSHIVSIPVVKDESTK